MDHRDRITQRSGSAAPPMSPKDRRLAAGPARGEAGWVVAVLVLWVAVVMLAAGGVAGAVVVSGKSDHPDEWDPRVTELVAFVERERGLTFEHPVEIHFLDDAAFREEMTSSETLDEKGQAQVRSVEAMLRALGLLGGSVDLLAAGDELAADGVVGAYSPEEQRIVIRGQSVDDQRRSTLVHELTHALQDQHFDIGGYSEDEGRTSGEIAAHTAAVEADAEKVEEAWLATLPAAARESLEAAESDPAEAPPDFKGVPEVFVEIMAFPYVFGPPFLEAVVAKEGAAGRNRLLSEPPTSEEHILLPETYLNRQPAQKVETPALKDGETLVEESEGDVGMLSLLIMLAERIDFGVAWPAVQGWAGDSFVAFERAGATCVRADVVFDSAPQAERFAGAFAQWSAGRPASHLRVDRMVAFESCDPGAAAAGRAQGHVSGIEGLALRKALAAGLAAEGLPADAACTADGIIERVGADRIAERERLAESDPRVRATMTEIRRVATEVVRGCR